MVPVLTFYALKLSNNCLAVFPSNFEKFVALYYNVCNLDIVAVLLQVNLALNKCCVKIWGCILTLGVFLVIKAISSSALLLSLVL